MITVAKVTIGLLTLELVTCNTSLDDPCDHLHFKLCLQKNAYKETMEDEVAVNPGDTIQDIADRATELYRIHCFRTLKSEMARGLTNLQ